MEHIYHTSSRIYSSVSLVLLPVTYPSSSAAPTPGRTLVLPIKSCLCYFPLEGMQLLNPQKLFCCAEAHRPLFVNLPLPHCRDLHWGGWGTSGTLQITANLHASTYLWDTSLLENNYNYSIAPNSSITNKPSAEWNKHEQAVFKEWSGWTFTWQFQRAWRLESTASHITTPLKSESISPWSSRKTYCPVIHLHDLHVHRRHLCHPHPLLSADFASAKPDGREKPEQDPLIPAPLLTSCRTGGIDFGTWVPKWILSNW